MAASRWSIAAGILVLVAGRAPAQDARVTIVTILASAAHQDINPKLQQIAAEVRKHEPSLTGFRIHSIESKDLNLGQKESFQLMKDVSADVTVLAQDKTKNRIQLAVKPPQMGEVTFSIAYDKYLPIVTRQLAANDRLILAIMAQPPKPANASAK
jgi:uncharacterized protein YqfA (UPF0365 family)